MARGKKNPDTNRAKADATWQKTLDAQRKLDADKVAAIEEWIKSNEDLWNQLSDVQRATIADIGNMATEMDVLHSSTEAVKDVAKVINDEIKLAGRGNTQLVTLGKSINDLWVQHGEEIKKGTKKAQNHAKVIAGTVDMSGQMLANASLIGTEEFQNLNISRLMAKAKAEGAHESFETLKLVKEQQNQLQRMHDTISETGDILKQPFEAIDGFIQEIPVIGKLLSKIFPVGQWGEDFAESFMASAGEAAKDAFFSGDLVNSVLGIGGEAGDENVQFDNNTIATNENTTALVVLKDTISSTMGQAAETPDISKEQEEAFETPIGEASPIDNFTGPVQMTLTGPVQMIVQAISELISPEVNGEIGAGGNNQLGEGTGIGLPAGEQPLQLTEGTPLALPEPSPTEEEFFKAGLTEGSIYTHLSNVGEIAEKIAENIKGAFGGGEGGKTSTNTAPFTTDTIEPDVGGAEDMAKNTEDTKENMKETDSFASRMGKKWGTMSTTGKMFAGTVATIGVGLAGWVISTFKFTRELGFAMGELPATAVLFKDEVSALAEEFGTLRDVNNQLLLDMWIQKMLHGVQVGDMAKIAKIQGNITGLSKEMAIEQQAKWMKEFKKEGLAANKIMEDMAQNADFIAMGTKGMGDNMKDAAAYAGKMGTSMSDMDTVATSLLDYQTSITAEAELQALTGKAINLDKARQLAYEQDYVGMAEAVKNQLGGQHEFSKMSRIEREAIGELLNLQGASLANFVGAQVKQSEATKEGLSATAKNFIMITGALGAILGGLAFFTGGSSLAGLWAMAKGAAFGGAVGFGGVKLAEQYKGMEAGDIKSGAGGVTQVTTKEGGIFNPSDNDETVVAPNAIATMERGLQGPPIVNVDMKQVTDELKPELQNIVAAVVQRSEDAKDQARRQKRATEDSGKSR